MASITLERSVHEAKIGFENFLLGHAALELNGSDGLDHFGAKRAGARLQCPHQLERQRGGTRHAPALEQILECGTDDRDGVDAVMLPETLVLEANQRRDVRGIDVLQLARNTPFSIGRNSDIGYGAIFEFNQCGGFGQQPLRERCCFEFPNPPRTGESKYRRDAEQTPTNELPSPRRRAAWQWCVAIHR
jgi:hypothetical protein